MIKETHFHLFHQLLLIVLLGFVIILFFSFAGNPDMQFKVAIGTSLTYFVWGLSHHALEGDLHPKIVVEYLLIALLAIFVLKGAIYK
jgi:hypothetical protein